MINKINNLSLIVNEHDYGRETTYVTLGISGGFCTDGLYETENKKLNHINKATTLIFSMMVKIHLKSSYRKRCKIKVNKTNFNITIKTKQRTYSDDLFDLLNTVYSKDCFNEELFIEAKEKVLEDFTDKYSNIKFKAYLNMLEFSDNNKAFKFTDLAKDIKNIAFVDFEPAIEKLVTFKNSVLLINGQINSEAEKFIQFILDHGKEEQDIQLTYPVSDPYLETDMHLIQYDKANLEMGALKFNFLGQDISLEERYLLLNYIGMILFSNNFDVNVDSVDNSIIYMDNSLQEYKNKIYEIFDESNFDEVKTELLSINNKIILEKPYMFNNLFASLLLNNIDYIKYLDLLTNSDKPYLKELLYKSDLKITEAHLIFKEREAFVNGKG